MDIVQSQTHSLPHLNLHIAAIAMSNIMRNAAFIILTVLPIWCRQRASAVSCDPRLPHCRNDLSIPEDGSRPACKPIWLIPKGSNDCTKPTSQQFMKIDPQSVVISPNPVKLPGCFTLSMRVDILVSNSDTDKSHFAKVEYEWWNYPQFANLPCQNTSPDGCGGVGNNCYYCDICRNLQEIETNGKVRNNPTVQQFRDVQCPSKSGSYRLQKEFCFNDFSDLDKDRNCRPDFLEQNTRGGAVNYKDALKNIETLGIGTVTAKFTLAHNATSEQRLRKIKKEAELEESVDAELTQKRLENGWAMNDDQYVRFRNWYAQFKKDKWHKQEYMPWLLYSNEIGCLTVNFEACNRAPTPMAPGSVTMLCV